MVGLNPSTPIIRYDGERRLVAELTRPAGNVQEKEGRRRGSLLTANTHQLPHLDLPAVHLSPVQAWIQSFTTGKCIGMMELDRSVFGVNPKRPDLIRRAIDYELSWLAQGTESSKSLGQVRGSTAKKFPQKGRGAARHGHLRANLMKGGRCLTLYDVEPFGPGNGMGMHILCAVS